MTDLRVEDRLAQRIDRLGRSLLESNEGKASAAPSHIVSHDRTVYYLTEAFEIVLHIALYIHQSEKRKVRHEWRKILSDSNQGLLSWTKEHLGASAASRLLRQILR